MSKRAATDFLKCFATLDKAFAKNKVLLAGLLVSAENLIPKDSWTDEMSNAVLNANCKEDSRCNSHILQLLAFKAPRESFERFAESILKFAKGPDFRSVGNYMILKAQNGLTDELLNTCKKMLKSKIELEVATGIYVSSKIIQDQRERDAVALSQFGQVPNLIFKIRGLQKSESAMISTRAFVEMRELESLENAEQTI